MAADLQDRDYPDGADLHQQENIVYLHIGDGVFRPAPGESYPHDLCQILVVRGRRHPELRVEELCGLEIFEHGTGRVLTAKDIHERFPRSRAPQQSLWPDVRQ